MIPGGQSSAPIIDTNKRHSRTFNLAPQIISGWLKATRRYQRINFIDDGNAAWYLFIWCRHSLKMEACTTTELPSSWCSVFIIQQIDDSIPSDSFAWQEYFWPPHSPSHTTQLRTSPPRPSLIVSDQRTAASMAAYINSMHHGPFQFVGKENNGTPPSPAPPPPERYREIPPTVARHWTEKM